MAEIQEVEIIFRPDGRVETRVSGVKGPSCLKLTEELFQWLGGQVERQELTNEYYEQAVQQSEWESQKQW